MDRIQKERAIELLAFEEEKKREALFFLNLETEKAQSSLLQEFRKKIKDKTKEYFRASDDTARLRLLKSNLQDFKGLS